MKFLNNLSLQKSVVAFFIILVIILIGLTIIL